MKTYIVRFILGGLACLFAIQSAAYGKAFSCETIEACEIEATAALNASASQARHANYYLISRAFAKFDQDGFDSLFAMMERAVGDNQNTLLAALSNMINYRGNAQNLRISLAQYETLIHLWPRENDNYYVLAELINRADTAASHSFILKALKSPDKKRRHWVKHIINMKGFGDGKSVIDPKHLSDILSLIRNQKHAALVPALLRIESSDAKSALWSLLDTDDRWVFDKAFSVLQKEDEGRVYAAVKAQSFVDTTAGRQRALMIAETIRQQRHSVKPSAQAYHFWTDWYEAAETSETEKIIPSYLLFHLFEATQKIVEGSDKYIEDRERWRGFTQANPEDRTGNLSVENLNREIKEKRAETSRLRPLLRLQTARLTQDETQTFQDYFRIFDAQRESVTEKKYTYGGGDYISLPSVLDMAIQSPELWAARFWTYVKDETFVENTALVEKITALEADEARLKRFYLRRLEQTENVPKLLETIGLISRNEMLRTDHDIKAVVQAVTNNTPFTRLHMAGEHIQSGRLPDNDINPFIFIIWGSSSEAEMMAANAKRKYCAPTSLGASDYMPVQPKLNPPLHDPYNQLSQSKMTVRTPSGYLSGYDSGEFGGGLVYNSDMASEGQLLPLRYAINIIAISESETKGVYWVLAGLNHLMPGMGVVYQVDARTDHVLVSPFKRLPSVPYSTTFLEDGGLFMDFRARSYTSFDMENGGRKAIHKLEDEKYNPPVILTQSGELVSACED